MKNVIKKISPAQAKKFLEANTNNRPLNEVCVDFLIREIAGNRWKVTGDPIKFSKKGRLLDGQHRLTAISKAGKTVEVFVIEGLEEEVFDVIDTGKSRTSKDILALNGISNGVPIGTLISLVLAIDEYGFAENVTSDRGFRVNKKRSNEEIKKYTLSNKSIITDVEFIIQGRKKFNYITLTILTVLHHYMKRKNPKQCEEFFSKFFDGHALLKTDPLFVLRNKLMSDVRGKLNGRDKLILFIVAWNLTRKNQSAELLIIPKDSTIPEII